MNKKLEVGQTWLTRDGYPAVVRDILPVGERPVRCRIERLDENIQVDLDGRAASSNDDLVSFVDLGAS